MEQADRVVSKTIAERHVGSNPTGDTISKGEIMMSAELYRVDYTVSRDFEGVVRSSFLYAASATSAVDWIRRDWSRKHNRDISMVKVQAVPPMIGKIVATTWAQP